MTVGSHIHCEA